MFIFLTLMSIALLFFIVLCAASAHFVGAMIPILARMAVRLGMVDRPTLGGRKQHDRPVPPIGGLVIFPVYMVLLPTLGITPFDHTPLFIALLLLIGAGALDDYAEISPNTKFAAQLAAALIMTLSGTAALPHLGHLFGVAHLVDLAWLSIPFTAVCFIFLINAMNMIDGLDGLAGGGSFIMLGWLALAAALGGDVQACTAALLLTSLLFGFLLHNMRYPGHTRATVFLGDAGSMSLGLIIAWLGVRIATPVEGAGMPPIAMAFIIALPIFDAFALFITRRIHGRGAFEAGRDHLHHRLLARGFSPARVTHLILTLVFLSGAVGVFGPRLGLGEGIMTLLWIVTLLGYTAYLIKRGKSLYSKTAET